MAYAICPKGCNCTTDEEKEVLCDGSDLTYLPSLLNPRLRKLSISHSQLRFLDTDTLELYPELEYLDLSYNDIESVTGSFRHQRKLISLFLRNNKLSHINDGDFIGLTSLKILDLSENRLQYIEQSAFKDLSSLLKLDMSNNLLTYFDANAFSDLDLLETLNVSSNRLQAISPFAFSFVQNIQEIDASHNLISIISSNAFYELTNLRRLDLSSNLLSSIAENAFFGWNILSHLNLSNNMIEHVLNVNIGTLSKLEVLDMSRNSFYILSTSSFEGLTNLRNLKLSHQQNLAEIQLNAFSGLANLQHLNLSHSTLLQVINPNAFEITSGLTHLDLSYCSIRHLSPTLVDWQRLKKLKLDGNPLHCDSQLLSFLPNVLTNLSIVDLRCSGPADLFGRRISFLAADDPLNEAIIFIAAILICVLISLILLIFLYILSFRQRCLNSRETYANNHPQRCSIVLNSSKSNKQGQLTEIIYPPSELTASTASTFADIDHYVYVTRPSSDNWGSYARSNGNNSIYEQPCIAVPYPQASLQNIV